MSDPSSERDSTLYSLLRDGKIEDFNEARGDQPCDLRGCSFRAFDLRGLKVDGIDFRDAHFRGADLRGIDFREASIEGASFIRARISGAYFPRELAPSELSLSLEHGTRVRYKAGR